MAPECSSMRPKRNVVFAKDIAMSDLDATTLSSSDSDSSPTRGPVRNRRGRWIERFRHLPRELYTSFMPEDIEPKVNKADSSDVHEDAPKSASSRRGTSLSNVASSDALEKISVHGDQLDIIVLDKDFRHDLSISCSPLDQEREETMSQSSDRNSVSLSLPPEEDQPHNTALSADPYLLRRRAQGDKRHAFRRFYHDNPLNHDPVAQRQSFDNHLRGTGTTHDDIDTKWMSALHANAMFCFRLGQGFFVQTFVDPQVEQMYQKESWHAAKPAALFSCLFLFSMWVTFVVNNNLRLLHTKIMYYGLASAAIIPMFFYVAFNLPIKFPLLYQVHLFCGTWIMPIATLITVYRGHYLTEHATYAEINIVALLIHPIVYSVTSIFMLRASRFSAAVGSAAYIILLAYICATEKASLWPKVVNMSLLFLAVSWASYIKERADRNMFKLRMDLDAQYKTTRRAQKAERKAEASRQTFNSYIFHEVRVPLNTALLACENITHESEWTRGRDLMRNLTDSLHTTENVLNNVLDFQRMESGRLTWSQSQPFDLGAVLQEAIDGYQPMMVARRIRLVQEFDRAVNRITQGVVLGDKARTAQVFKNLLSNAVRFSPPGGVVTCTTQLLYPLAIHKDPRQVAIIRFSIKDTGRGIQPSDLQDNRLFSPYVQTEAGINVLGKGSGLGLALVRESIKLAGGRLGVQSTLGQGSTFWFELCFGIAQTSATADGRLSTLPVVSKQSASKKLRILLVDDDKLTRKIVGKMLSRQCHTIEEAGDGLEAIVEVSHQLNQDEGFDLIIIDNLMKHMNGPEAIVEMRRLGDTSYIVGLSGSDTREDFIDAGANDTLMKPISEASLLELIQHVTCR